MTITAQPYDDRGAMAVLRNLDPYDLIEAQLVRGISASHLAIFADWRAVESARLMSLVLRDARHGGVPFAVLGLSHTGQAGVAQAALLARDHRRFRRALGAAGAAIRRKMPEFCQDNGIHRIEARAWADHPTASRFLAAVGFAHEADMPGFGADGTVTYRQFAWINPTITTGEPPCVLTPQTSR